MFMGQLAAGKTTGEAAYFAQPVLSWMNVFLGDPLYRPFQRTLEDQVKALPGREDSSNKQYVVLREMQRLRAEGNTDGALEFGRGKFFSHPGLGLAHELALHAEDKAELSGYAQVAIGAAAHLQPDQWGVAHHVAAHLREVGELDMAMGIYRNMFGDRSLPLQVRKQLGMKAADVAVAVGDLDTAMRWRQEAESK